MEERLSSVQIAERMGSNTTTICELVKPFPLTRKERAKSNAANIARGREVRAAKSKYVGGNEWTQEEIARLRQRWPSATRERIETSFPGRSWDAISRQAATLGIRRSRVASSANTRFIDPLFAELREMREAQGLTRDQVAERGGFHKIMLAHWERGEARPGWLMLRTWLDTLQVELHIVPLNRTLTERGKRPWLADEESILADLLAQGSNIQEAALALKRPAHDVEKRARTLGLLESELMRNVSGMTKLRF